MAIRINRVYTRGGDAGETSLVGGRRIAKDAIRIESYGTVDELNALLGLVRTANRDAAGAARKGGSRPARRRPRADPERAVQSRIGSRHAAAGPPSEAARHRSAPRLVSREDDRRPERRPAGAEVLRAAGRRLGLGIPAPGAHRLPPGRAPRDDARPAGGRGHPRPRLSQSPLGSALRAGPLGREDADRSRSLSGTPRRADTQSALAARAATAALARASRPRPRGGGGSAHRHDRDPVDERLRAPGGGEIVLSLRARERAPLHDPLVVHSEAASLPARRRSPPGPPRRDRAEPARVRALPQGLRARGGNPRRRRDRRRLDAPPARLAFEQGRRDDVFDRSRGVQPARHRPPVRIRMGEGDGPLVPVALLRRSEPVRSAREFPVRRLGSLRRPVLPARAGAPVLRARRQVGAREHDEALRTSTRSSTPEARRRPCGRRSSATCS